MTDTAIKLYKEVMALDKKLAYAKRDLKILNSKTIMLKRIIHCTEVDLADKQEEYEHVKEAH